LTERRCDYVPHGWVVFRHDVDRPVTAQRDSPASPGGPTELETPYAWLRLGVSLLIMTIGSVGMWSAVVVLPAIQAEFAATRADASLPYTMSMVSFVVGQILMGRLADRFGVFVPVVAGATALALGYAGASAAASLWQFTAAYGLLIGFLGSRWPSARAAAILRGRSGRRSCSTSRRPPDGARRIWASGCSAR
jgi:MFS family permease